jgi:hypothetical protein
MNTESPPPDSAPPQPQAPQPQDPRRRLRELLAIPERDRTDAQWDEIVELEIQTAPGNRITPLPGGHGGGGGGGGGGRQPQQQKKSHFKGQGGRQKPRKPNPGNP